MSDENDVGRAKAVYLITSCSEEHEERSYRISKYYAGRMPQNIPLLPIRIISVIILIAVLKEALQWPCLENRNKTTIVFQTVIKQQ